MWRSGGRPRIQIWMTAHLIFIRICISFHILWKRGENGPEVYIGNVTDLVQGGVYSIIVQQQPGGAENETPNVCIAYCVHKLWK